MNKNLLNKSIMLLLAQAAWSANAQTDNRIAELEFVDVIGYKENGIDETLNDVDIVPLSNLRDASVVDVRSAFKYSPVIEVTSGTSEQIRIRGFGKNYTEMTIDGEPTTEFINFGSNTFGGKNIVEIDTLKQIDIVKGRHSPKQSGGAVAGTVNMQTYSPSDFVDSEDPYYFSLKTGYTSKNRGVSGGLTSAFSNGAVNGLAIYSYRNFHELENFGSEAEGTLRDEENAKQQNLLLKGEMELDAGRVLVTGEHFDLTQDVLEGTETSTKRNRLSASVELENVLHVDTLQAKLFASNYQQDKDGEVSNNIEQERLGISFDATKTIDADIQHNLMFGGGFSSYNIDWLLSSNKPIFGFSGKTGRYLPKTKTKEAILYVQDEIIFNNGLTVTPALRLEHKKYRSKTDAAYNNNKGLAAQKGYVPNNSYTAVIPSLRVAMPVNEKATVFASYAKGAKNADSANIGSFAHPSSQGTFYIMPNPDLENEASNNFELGFNYIDEDKFDFKINAFYDKFKNLITYSRGIESDGTKVARPANVKKQKVYGLELETNFAINNNWSTHAGLSWTRGSVGDKESHGVALTSATPTTAVLGINYHNEEVWGASLDYKFVGKGEKTEKAGSNQQDPRFFRTPSYGVADLTAWWKPTKGMTLSGGIYNVLDEKYWLNADVNGFLANSVTDKDTQPGRNFAASFKYEF